MNSNDGLENCSHQIFIFCLEYYTGRHLLCDETASIQQMLFPGWAPFNDSHYKQYVAKKEGLICWKRNFVEEISHISKSSSKDSDFALSLFKVGKSAFMGMVIYREP